MSSSYHEELLRIVNAGRLEHERKEAVKRAEKDALVRRIEEDARAYFDKFVGHLRENILKNPTRTSFGWSTDFSSYYPLEDGDARLLKTAQDLLKAEFPEASVSFDHGDGYKTYLAFSWKVPQI